MLVLRGKKHALKLAYPDRLVEELSEHLELVLVFRSGQKVLIRHVAADDDWHNHLSFVSSDAANYKPAHRLSEAEPAAPRADEDAIYEPRDEAPLSQGSSQIAPQRTDGCDTPVGERMGPKGVRHGI